MANRMPGAMERLVAEHGGTVLRVCRSIVRDEHLGADAAQETFVRAWTRLSAGAAPERATAWLRRIAVTASLDLLRRGRTRADALDRFAGPGRAEHAAGGEARAADPAERAAHAELRERLETALARLPEGQRTVFLLRHEGGLTLREVAETLDVALPTAKTQFARACLRLQDALAAFAPEHAAGRASDSNDPDASNPT